MNWHQDASVYFNLPKTIDVSLFSVAHVTKLAERGYTSWEPRGNLSERVKACMPIGMFVVERVTA